MKNPTLVSATKEANDRI